MNGQEIVALYEIVWSITRLMQEAAKKSEWDDLAVLDEKRIGLLEKLMASDRGDLADIQLNGQKAEWIRKILVCDAETKSLAEEWMVELRQILDSLGAEKKLIGAYADRE